MEGEGPDRVVEALEAQGAQEDPEGGVAVLAFHLNENKSKGLVKLSCIHLLTRTLKMFL